MSEAQQAQQEQPVMNGTDDPMDVDPPELRPDSKEPEPQEPAPTTTRSDPTPADESSKPSGDSKPESGSSKQTPPEPTSAEPDAAPDAAPDADEPAPDPHEVIKTIDLDALGDGARLTVPELEALHAVATELKTTGNKAFTSRPKRLKEALEDYHAALRLLPAVPYHLPPPSLEDLVRGSRFAEITDEEADQIAADEAVGHARIRADLDIRELARTLWANIGAVYAVQHKDPETVEACTKSLALDPRYPKALQRRAAANERIGTWSALASAERDLRLLTTLLPPGSAAMEDAVRSLEALPARMAARGEKETDDVLGKMADLKGQ